jgi:hypothetical protein
MDLTHWAYTAAALTTALAGILWTGVRLYFRVKDLRREARILDARAELEATKAEAEAARIRDSVPSDLDTMLEQYVHEDDGEKP